MQLLLIRRVEDVGDFVEEVRLGQVPLGPLRLHLPVPGLNWKGLLFGDPFPRVSVFGKGVAPMVPVLADA
jgi:hypothetical protein